KNSHGTKLPKESSFTDTDRGYRLYSADGHQGAAEDPSSTRKCWNRHGKCRQKCFRKERVYVFCTNNKMCCVKPKYQPKNLPWKA
ncbi:hypothetical protein DBR06_SOUSAS4210154, partial [Sousa chinensis]